MKLLLDTHTFLWLDSSPEQLSQMALAACEDPANRLYLSVVSAWEIQIKRRINRLRLGAPLDQMIHGQQSANELRILPVELQHIYV
jgi:PIN domain nuclease of toxin-antitoxin system